MITSRQNPKIKLARSLQQKKARDREKKTLVEGIWHVGEALEAKAEIDSIFWAPDRLTSDFGEKILETAAARGIPTYPVSPDVFDSLAEKSRPQGILAVVGQTATPLASLTPKTHPWIVALVSPQDPGNVGTILRTIDAVGANALILIDGGADPWHPTAIRAAMGATFWKPIAATNFQAFEKWAGGVHYTLIGTSAKGAISPQPEPKKPPYIFLFGSEQKGLLPDQLAICDDVLRLPMAGRVSSLNLAVSVGVVLYGTR